MYHDLDCEQSLFCSKIRGEERREVEERAYGKHGNPESGIRNPEPEPEPKPEPLNECFKFGSVIDFNPPPPFSALSIILFS